MGRCIGESEPVDKALGLTKSEIATYRSSASLGLEALKAGDLDAPEIDQAIDLFSQYILPGGAGALGLYAIITGRVEEFKFLVQELPITKFIPDPVSEGVRELPTNRQKADRLYDNFIAHYNNFIYGGYGNAKACLLTGTGDCDTLADTFCEVAKALGIDDATRQGQSYRGDCLFAPGPSFGREGTFNTHKSGKHYWAYGNHHWASAGGRIYDLLLGLRGTTQPAKFYGAARMERHESEVYYQVFDGGNICWIPPACKNLINTDIGPQGIVPGDEKDTIKFIIANT